MREGCLNYLPVSQPGQPVLRSSKQLSLIYTTKLSIDLEVLLVENLENGVQETGQWRVVRLLNDLGTGLLGVVFRHNRAELVDIHDAEYRVSFRADLSPPLATYYSGLFWKELPRTNSSLSVGTPTALRISVTQNL